MRNFSIKLAEDQLLFNNFFIIDYSKSYKNKISIFDINNNFYGDYYNIISAKFDIINNNLTKF